MPKTLAQLSSIGPNGGSGVFTLPQYEGTTFFKLNEYWAGPETDRANLKARIFNCTNKQIWDDWQVDTEVEESSVNVILIAPKEGGGALGFFA